MTTNQDPIETVVRRVAEGLGWEVLYDHPLIKSAVYIPGLNGPCNPSGDSDLIILAAYAEAAVRQNWIACPDHDKDTDVIRFGLINTPNWRYTSRFPYNNADPVSKAEAVLRGVDEAIGGGG